jgi:hypothetical protein
MRIVAHMFFVLAAFCCAGMPSPSVHSGEIHTELAIRISETQGRCAAFPVTYCVSVYLHNSKRSYPLAQLAAERIINAREKELFRQAKAISHTLKFHLLPILLAKNSDPLHLSWSLPKAIPGKLNSIFYKTGPSWSTILMKRFFRISLLTIMIIVAMCGFGFLGALFPSDRRYENRPMNIENKHGQKEDDDEDSEDEWPSEQLFARFFSNQTSANPFIILSG